VAAEPPASGNLFPSLDAATEAALRDSIERFGVLVPVAKDQHGNLLDGFHRSRIADELSVRYRVDVIATANEAEAREIARTLNVDRRHMSADQRRQVAVTLREQGHSTTAIAGAVGVSDETIRRDLSGSTYVEPETVLGRDGKRYPAKRPTVVAAKDEREAERAQQALATAEMPNTPVVDVRRAERLAREQESERLRAEPIEPVTQVDDIRIEHGDFREVLATEDLVDAIAITDPPYPREYLDTWEEMAQLLLEAGCEALVAMCGQSILPDALAAISYARNIMAEDEYTGEIRWTYRWCGAYLTIGPATRIHHAAIGTSWKPILVFDRGREREFLTTDVFRSTGDDKAHHHWGQNENGIAALVEAFTKPGDLVVDPFLGGGTTAVVCKALGRRFIGCDIDAAAVSRARARFGS
jgi:ParB-like chromosome segregation protein Spo0J